MPPNRTKRCFPNSGPILSVKLEDEIIRKLTLLVTKYNPEIHHYPKRECLGLYAGPTSVAYVFFYFAQSSKYKDTIVEGKKCAVWSQLYLDAANRVAVSDEILSEEDATHGGLIDGQETNSMHCGIINDELARAAVCAVLTKDSKYSDILLGYLSKILDGGSKYDEVVYGRTGYLFFLRLVNHYMPDTIPKTAYKQVIDVILSHPPWLFYGSLPYLGVGHGWAGIFLEIVLCDPSYAQQVQPYIEQMLDQQLESKNWPSNIHSSPPDGTENSERKDDDILVQWGHGAPGMVMTFHSLLPHYAYNPALCERMHQAIESAQDCIWKRGLLYKESSLCHGAAGNALALSNREQAAHFLAWSTEERVEKGLRDDEMEAASFRSSLMTGLAGRAFAYCAFEEERFGICLGFNEI